jgi:hypothetical protein
LTGIKCRQAVVTILACFARRGFPWHARQSLNSSVLPAACRRCAQPIDNGADAVYLGYRNDTNARNFAGLNFDHKAMVEGIRYAPVASAAGVDGDQHLRAARTCR